MRSSLDCIPCFARQALEAARFVTGDPAIHERVVRDVLRHAADMDLAQCPPAFAQRIHRQLRSLTGIADPYQAVKHRFNRMALAMLEDLGSQVRQSVSPLATALRLAIAGNVIDLGVNGGITEPEVRRCIGSAMSEPFCGDVEAFANALADARSILYLADNAGEIVFDRLLIEQLPLERVTLAVRGSAILNDATLVDAQAAGLCDLVGVIDNGSDAPGTILDDCSQSFRNRFAEADLVIAKGQGNYETLGEVDANLCFLFKAKCPVIAGRVRQPVGTHILLMRPCPQPATLKGKPK